jgi:hypothetical protein
MRLIPCLSILFLGLAAPCAQAQQIPQTQLQAFAQARYNDYNNARIATWEARAQGQPDYVIIQYLQNEQNAWNAFTQANNAAVAEANYQSWIAAYVAQVDSNIIAWQNYMRAIYDARDVPRYQTDFAYRTWWDGQTQAPLAYAQTTIQQLYAYRAQVVGAQSPAQPPPQPLSYDPRYSTPDGGPISDSWKRSLTIQ